MNTSLSREYTSFYNGLIAARKRQGLTQKVLAERLEKPQSFVAKYESGERRLDVIEFLQIAKAMQIDAVSLLKEMELV